MPKPQSELLELHTKYPIHVPRSGYANGTRFKLGEVRRNPPPRFVHEPKARCVLIVVPANGGHPEATHYVPYENIARLVFSGDLTKATKASAAADPKA